MKATDDRIPGGPRNPTPPNNRRERSRTRPSPGRYVLTLLALTAAYVLLGEVGLFTTYFKGVGSPIWLPTGFALAALLRWGVGYWPMILIGNLLVVAIIPRGDEALASLQTAFFIGVGNSLEGVLGYVLLTRFVRFDRSLSRVWDSLMLISVGGGVAPVVSVGFGLLSQYLTGELKSEDISRVIFVWWSGNLTGCVLMAPLVLGWMRPTPPRFNGSMALELAAFVLVTLGVFAACFGMTTEPARFAFPFAFLMFPPIAWAALRFGTRGVTLAAAVYAFMTVRGTLSGVGPFVLSVESQSEQVAAVSIFIVTLAGTGLLLSCAVRERELVAQARVDVEAKYHQLIDQASDGIFVTDLAGNYREANRRGLEMLGYTLEELRQKTIADLVVIDDVDRRPIRTGELNTGVHILSERRLRRKDGVAIPVEISAKKLGDGRFLGIVRDITQRRRDEAQRAMMMRELDHRVKNNLAIVLSIADQTARNSETVPEFSERFLGRIMSLARVHGLLARSRWSGADLESIVKRTLEPHTDAQRSQVRVEGEKCLVPSRAAGPLCMTLHELATNAVKYGALSVGEGAVTVRWQIERRDREPDRLRLTWEELGGPAVVEPTSRGFGTQLIEAGLAHEIGAVVSLEFRPAGVCCGMAFSLVDDPLLGVATDVAASASDPVAVQRR